MDGHDFTLHGYLGRPERLRMRLICRTPFYLPMEFARITLKGLMTNVFFVFNL